MAEITAGVEFQMTLLLFVALAGYLVASRIGQPAVVGIILVGLAIGPSGLSWVTYTGFVASLAELGAVILLFVVGLEFELRELANPRYMIIGAMGVALPLAGGYGLAWAWGHQGAAAWFIGVALTATSIAITADALREMGRLTTPAARAIIGAAVADDVLALLALGMVRSLGSGGLSAGQTIWALAQALGFVVVASLTGLKLLAPLLCRLDRTSLAKRYPEVPFIFAMMLAFLYALAAHLLGLSGIVGSFLAGVSLAGVRLADGRDFRAGAEHLRIIFAAVFFVSLGVLADLRALTWPVVWFLLALTVSGTLTKVLGCGLPAWALGLPPREALAVGVGMVPRGEVAMIVALIGLEQGVVDQPVYVALVTMSLLTTIFPPLILRNWIYRARGLGPQQ